MLLLTGPPGSGKTKIVLEKVAGVARRGGSGALLLTPTATMAEHLSHELARALGALPAGLIQTLHRFVAGFETAFAPLSDALLQRIVRRKLEAETPAVLQEVAGYRGFQRAVANLLKELSGAGVPAHRLERAIGACDSRPPHAGALVELLGQIEDELLERRKLLRGEHLRAVARRISEDGPGAYREILFNGFFTFTSAELDLIEAITTHAEVTVTLPRWPGSERTRERLLELGFAEKALRHVDSGPDLEIVRAQNEDAEATEIARRILAEAAAGRPFREMGVIIRSGDTYGPLIGNTLARFGIPSRLYLGRPPAADAGVQQLFRIMESLLNDWDLEPLLGAVQLGTAGAARDRLDFEMRNRVPARGLGTFREADKEEQFRWLGDRLEDIATWGADTVPADVWSKRLARLPGLLPDPPARSGARRDLISAWKLRNEALRAFVNAAREAEELFAPDERVPLEAFWEECRAILDDRRLYLRDRRRNVVHIIDAMEARQWELPVIFVCGLVEDRFPLRRPDNALLPDRTRGELRRQGIFLETSRERERQEEFLFQLAISRGTTKAFLSYPAHDQRGDPALPSFQLIELRESLGRSPESDTPAKSVRPASLRRRPAPRPPAIYAEDLRTALALRTARLSPSKIETFLSCPFQFFASVTLRLEEPPAPPADRLGPLLQGSIVHEVLHRSEGGVEPMRDLFAEIFQRVCREKNVQPGYQTERIRVELLRGLERFLEDVTLPLPADQLREQTFVMEITEDLAISGRIDRLDIDSARRALVIDYKLSSPESVRNLVKESEEGSRVQAGLYMLAAREVFGYTPAGMLYCSVKKQPEWRGWRLEGLSISAEVGTRCMPDELEDQMRAARATAIEVARRIREGEVAPLPSDEEPCRYCAGSDICRRLEAGRPLAVGGGGQ